MPRFLRHAIGLVALLVVGACPRVASAEPVAERFPAPAGFERVEVAGDSFGATLRGLPLLPAGTPVLYFSGQTAREGSDPHVAGVVDLDVGRQDLQQCADMVLRLWAEHRWARAKSADKELRVKTTSGVVSSYAGWLAGDRAKLTGKALSITRVASRRADDHAALRAWLDEVFAWTSTAALERDAKRVTFDAIAPGDFFVQRGIPLGHAVMVLDVARAADGRTALLLGQGYTPAQSFHVLRPSPDATWFVVEPGAREVATPFWSPFPVTSLRRMP